jgi:DNA-binding transcriptional MerR regulator
MKCKMKRRTIILILYFTVLGVSGQDYDIEKIMTKRIYSCWGIMRMFSDKISDGIDTKKDSAKVYSFLDLLEYNCRETGTTQSFRILFAINNDTFTESLYDSTIINSLLNYKEGLYYYYWDEDNYNYYSEEDRAFLDEIKDLKRIVVYTQELSKRLLAEKTSLSEVEKFLLEYYANYTLSLNELKKTEYNGTLLQEYFNHYRKKSVTQVNLNTYLKGGIWIPQGNLAIVGMHPEFGGALGMTVGPFYADFVMAFRWGKAPDYYQVLYNNTIYNTNHFFGMYVGADMGYRLFYYNRHRFDVVGGIAADGIDVLNDEIVNGFDEDESNHRSSIMSPNFNIGLGYKYQLKQSGRFIGLDLKYNFVNYKNTGGTDLSGNAVTIHLLFGFSKLWN